MDKNQNNPRDLSFELEKVADALGAMSDKILMAVANDLAALPDFVTMMVVGNLLASFEAVASPDQREIFNQLMEELRGNLNTALDSELRKNPEFIEACKSDRSFPQCGILYEGRVYGVWAAPEQVQPIIINPSDPDMIH